MRALWSWTMKHKSENSMGCLEEEKEENGKLDKYQQKDITVKTRRFSLLPRPSNTILEIGSCVCFSGVRKMRVSARDGRSSKAWEIEVKGIFKRLWLARTRIASLFTGVNIPQGVVMVPKIVFLVSEISIQADNKCLVIVENSYGCFYKIHIFLKTLLNQEIYSNLWEELQRLLFLNSV